MIESQIAYVADALRTMRARGLGEVEVKADVQARFNAGLQKQLGGSIWASGCKSWYVNAQGRNTTLWPGFTWQFRRITRRFDVDAYALSAGAATTTKPLDRAA